MIFLFSREKAQIQSEDQPSCGTGWKPWTAALGIGPCLSFLIVSSPLHGEKVFLFTAKI